MKDIKDYIGKKYIICCSNNEEWKRIHELLNLNINHDYIHVERDAIRIDNISNGNIASVKGYKGTITYSRYEFIKASEFMYSGILFEACKKFQKGSKISNKNLIPHCDTIFISSGDFKEECGAIYAVLKDESFTVYLNGKWAQLQPIDKLKDVTEKKFIENKWYKNLSSSKDYFGKFVKLTSSGCFYCNGYIHNKYYPEEGNLTSDLQNATECSLAEIQQYLPEGHPDKRILASQMDSDGDIVLPSAWRGLRSHIMELPDLSSHYHDAIMASMRNRSFSQPSLRHIAMDFGLEGVEFLENKKNKIVSMTSTEEEEEKPFRILKSKISK